MQHPMQTSGVHMAVEQTASVTFVSTHAMLNLLVALELEHLEALMLSPLLSPFCFGPVVCPSPTL